MIARRVIASGRVQGVAYRAFCGGAARRLGLSGFVRNLQDGRVEAVIAGEAGAVDAMLALMRRGPPHAAVRDLASEEARPPGESGFRILPDA